MVSLGGFYFGFILLKKWKGIGMDVHTSGLIALFVFNCALGLATVEVVLIHFLNTRVNFVTGGVTRDMLMR